MLEIMKILVSAEFFFITVLSFVLLDKYKISKKTKFLNFMTYVFVVVGAIILSTFVFFTG